MFTDFFSALSESSEMLQQDYIIIAAAYFIGSIPFGLLLTKIFGLGDIRKIGSGNIGATNVLRTGNKKVALLTLLLDGSKGAIVVVVAREISSLESTALLAGTIAVVGHIFPIWLKFKGGKGVATTLAVFIALYPPMGIVACLTWIIVFVVSRVSSLSAVLTMTAAPVIAFYFASITGFGLVYLTLFLSILVIVKHTSNIRRLIVGQEKTIDWK